MPEIPTLVILLVVPAVIGLTNLLKTIGLPTRFAGLVSVGLGVVAMVAYTLWGDVALFENIMIGLLIGLAASGFYDLTKLVGVNTTRTTPIPGEESRSSGPHLHFEPHTGQAVIPADEVTRRMAEGPTDPIEFPVTSPVPEEDPADDDKPLPPH